MRAAHCALALALSLGAQELPPDLEGRILLQSLSFDRSLHPYDHLDMVLAAPVWDRPGQRHCAALARELGLMDSLKALGVPLHLTVISLKTAREASTHPALKSAHVVYLAGGWESDLEPWLDLTEQRQWLLCAGVSELVERGVPLGLTLVEGRPKLFINLSACKRGAQAFDARLLQLAKLVR